MEDGRMNILVQGSKPFRLLERREELAYPAGTVEFLDDSGESDDEEAGGEARERYADLLEKVTEERPEESALEELSAYEMAASVDIDLVVKQGLLEQRSEAERLRMLARLFKDGAKRLALTQRIAERARSNGKVAFEE
jgi:Lon protease-like protein